MATINYNTAAGQVRLLIADTDTPQILTDDQITGYLSGWGVADTDPVVEHRSGIRRAAADALDAIATSEALISKVIRTQDLSTNGPQTADALRKHAQVLRDQADEWDDDGSFFGVAEFTPYPPGSEAAERPVPGWW